MVEIVPIRPTIIAAKPSRPFNPSPSTGGVDFSTKSREERGEVVAKLFRDHNRALVSFLRTKLHNDAEAREVAQEAYVKLLQLETPGVVSFLQGYLFKIAANLAVDRIRHQAVGQRIVQEDAFLFEEADDFASPERICLGRAELDRILKAMEHLPAKCRAAFELHVLSEKPVKDVAKQLGVSPRMVCHYLADALQVCRSARRDDDEAAP